MKNVILLLFFALTTTWSFSQRTVSGTIVDDTGEALIGANILVKSTEVGTISDIDGKFTLDVPADASTLVISYTGYGTQEIDISNTSEVIVTLLAGEFLDEVVVTALNIARQDRSLGYAVSVVSGDQVEQKAEPDVLRALQGKIPGVNISGSSGAPGSATRITIRGTSSFLGDNQPLFIVDGIPFDNTQYNSTNQLSGGGAYGTPLANIDPNNIESINVLKGSASAALYGSRASNGVVIINTKTGSAGSSSDGLAVTVSSSYFVEQIAGLPDYQNTYGNGADFLFQNANGSWGPAFSSLDSIPLWGPLANNFQELPAVIPYEAQPNNVEGLFDNGHVFENSLIVSTGGDNYSLSTALSHLDQDGYIPFSGFKRTTLSLGVTGKLENNFTIGGNLSYTKSTTEGPFFGENGSASPDAASSFARTLWLGRAWDLSFPYELQGGGSVIHNGANIDHPLWSWEHNGLDEETNRIGASFSIQYDFSDWLNLKYQLGTNQYTTRRQLVWDIGSVGYAGSGAILDDDFAFEELESNLILSGTRPLNDDIDISFIAGQNINQRERDQQSVLGTILSVPGIFDIDNTNALVPNGGNYSKRRLMGLFYEVGFNYRDYLFITTTGRNDWSSTLPTSSRSFFYPSVSLSAVLDEALGIQSDILSGLRARISWAKVGKDAEPYSLSNTFNINHGQNTGLIGSVQDNDFPFNGQPGITQSNVASDPDLTPEFTSEVEFGLGVGLFKDRVDLDVTLYKRNSTDQIANVSIPSASGFEQFVTNFGDLENKGIEIGLGVTPFSSNNGFTWKLYTSFSKNESEILELADGIERVNIRNLFGGGIRPVLEVGQPYGAFYGTQSARDAEGNFLIDPNTGSFFPSTQDNGFGIIGDPNPNFILGINNTLSYKGLNFGVVIDYRDGGDIYSTTVERLLGRGVAADTEDRESSIVLPGFLGDRTTGQPILDENGSKIPNTIQVTTNDLFFQPGFGGYFINAADEHSVYDGTNIRLREVSLGYDLPPSLLNGTPFGRASITLTGRNLWRYAPNIPHSTNFDPEVNGFGATNTQGIEYAAAPQSKRYGVNLKFSF